MFFRIIRSNYRTRQKYSRCCGGRSHFEWNVGYCGQTRSITVQRFTLVFLVQFMMGSSMLLSQQTLCRTHLIRYYSFGYSFNSSHRESRIENPLLYHSGQYHNLFSYNYNYTLTQSTWVASTELFSTDSLSIGLWPSLNKSIQWLDRPA